METIAKQLTRRLYWVQNKTFGNSFELRNKNGLFGTLKYNSGFGMNAIGQINSGSWAFNREGFLNPRVTIQELGGVIPTAVYRPKFWGDGIMKFASGKEFFWIPLSIWRTAWGFSTQDERLLVRLSPGSEKSNWRDILKNQAIVDIEPNAQRWTELPLLILAGWYLTNLQFEENAAAVGAISASSAV